MKDDASRSLLFRDVSISFGRRRVISRLSCDLPVGVHWIEARNGVGKTTLLEMAVGVASPVSGRIFWCDRPVKNCQRQGASPLGYCPAKPSYYEGARIEDAVRLYQMLHRVSAPKDVFSEFDPFGLDAVRALAFGDLSFGWKRRVLLHMVFSLKASVLALDEPFVGLDDDGCAALQALLVARHASGVTLVTGHASFDIDRKDFYRHALSSSGKGAQRQTVLKPLV